jgi:hypothetical protein
MIEQVLAAKDPGPEPVLMIAAPPFCFLHVRHGGARHLNVARSHRR